ncbi:ATP-binding protein [Streptomyces cellostaticus]|uniref:ATP-binding protein n=1 Tax=Streptomyces TaxID=1883 RepID=UPI00202615AA|nr:ATP-binding protein [Streptomyces cellostaticus]
MDIRLSTHTATQTRPGPLRHSRTWDRGAPRIAEARDAVGVLLAQALPAPGGRAVQDAKLVASELVTNAVKHAPGPCALRLELSPDATALSITVVDTSPELPRQPPPDPARVGGHGLLLVNMLSGGLEVAPLPHGKRVTATVALHSGGRAG